METTYTAKEIKVKGNVFSIVIASGKLNYISIRKETNNPYKTAGKQFDNFDEAAAHYKTPEMKVELLKIELGLI